VGATELPGPLCKTVFVEQFVDTTPDTCCLVYDSIGAARLREAAQSQKALSDTVDTKLGFSSKEPTAARRWCYLALDP
jgi:hypothetical protein